MRSRAAPCPCRRLRHRCGDGRAVESRAAKRGEMPCARVAGVHDLFTSAPSRCVRLVAVQLRCTAGTRLHGMKALRPQPAAPMTVSGAPRAWPTPLAMMSAAEPVAAAHTQACRQQLCPCNAAAPRCGAWYPARRPDNRCAWQVTVAAASSANLSANLLHLSRLRHPHSALHTQRGRSARCACWLGQHVRSAGGLAPDSNSYCRKGA